MLPVSLQDRQARHRCGGVPEPVVVLAGQDDPARLGDPEDSIYFDHSGECRAPETHRHCLGRWRGVVSLKPGPDGQRRRKKVSGIAR